MRRHCRPPTLSRVYVLRLLWYLRDASHYCDHKAVVVELLPPDPPATSALPPEFVWLPRESALKATWPRVHPQLDTGRMLRNLFKDALDSAVSHDRAPWRRLGWFQQINAWLMSVLRDHGLQPTAELQQVRNMLQSSVLRCKVSSNPLASSNAILPSWNTTGFVYVKTTGFVYVKTTISVIPEAQLTSTVSRVMGSFVPRVLATSKTNLSFVQIGAHPWFDLEPVLIMETLAELYIRSLERIDDLLDGGVPDRGLAWLSASISYIIEHPAFDSIPNDQHLVELRGGVGEIRSLCDKLMGFGIPHTLVHGDCDITNVCGGIEPEWKLSFMDWANCCIAHPYTCTTTGV